VSAMREAVHAQVSMSPEEVIRWPHLGSELATDLWDDALLRDIVKRHEDAARVQGSLPALLPPLIALAANDIRAGRFGTARERYSELHGDDGRLRRPVRPFRCATTRLAGGPTGRG
jgi:hypothetical protein